MYFFIPFTVKDLGGGKIDIVPDFPPGFAGIVATYVGRLRGIVPSAVVVCPECVTCSGTQYFYVGESQGSLLGVLVETTHNVYVEVDRKCSGCCGGLRKLSNVGGILDVKERRLIKAYTHIYCVHIPYECDPDEEKKCLKIVCIKLTESDVEEISKEFEQRGIMVLPDVKKALKDSQFCYLIDP